MVPKSSFVLGHEGVQCRLCNLLAVTQEHDAWKLLLRCPRCGATEVRSKLPLGGRLALKRAALSLREKGIRYTSRSILLWVGALYKYVLVRFTYHYINLTKRSATFVFGHRSYHYFYHEYNLTWRNERAVEVPILWDIVTEYRGRAILEVGNVLSHYFPVSHDIVDKYERAPGVINADVVDYRTSKKYDLIVSISTLEHVGWDERPPDPTKILRAIQNLKSLLAPRGKIVVSLPLGQNPALDKLLDEGRIRFSETHYLKRVSRDDKWIEAEWDQVRGSDYGKPFPAGNGLVIGVIKNER